MLIFHWQLPFKCQFTSRCWELAFVPLIKSQKSKVWGLALLRRAIRSVAAGAGRPWRSRAGPVKRHGQRSAGKGAQQQPLNGLWQPNKAWRWHFLVTIIILETIPSFGGRLAVARIKGKCWTEKGTVKCSGAGKKKETKIYSNRRTSKIQEGGGALSTVPDICMYFKSFQIKFIMNLIQSPTAQRSVLSNRIVSLRDRRLPSSRSVPATRIYIVGT